MDPTWLAALVFVALSAAFTVGFLAAAAILRARARKPDPAVALTYECGETPTGSAWVRFHPRYYVVALLFVLFDVETVFILPWALNVGDARTGGAAIVEMFVFVGILLLGWGYALRKGALRWQ